MEKVYEFLKNAGVYYIATVDGDQPHVRPFGTINIFEGKLYVQTGKSKDVSKPIQVEQLSLTLQKIVQERASRVDGAREKEEGHAGR